MPSLAENIIGGIGSATTITYFLSPSFVIYRLIRYGEAAEEMPFLIYVFTILNCEFWALYGVIEKSWPLYLTIFTGFTLNVTYLLIYIFFQKNTEKGQKIRTAVILVLSLIITFLFFYFFLPSYTILGTVAAISDMCMCFSPFQYVNQMYQEKNNIYMPLSITLFMGFNNIAWTLFGFVKELDCFIILPNFLGLLFNFLQVFMWIQFYNPKTNSCKSMCTFCGDDPSIEQGENVPLKTGEE